MKFLGSIAMFCLNAIVRCIIRPIFTFRPLVNFLEFIYLRSSLLQAIFSFRIWHENFRVDEDELGLDYMASSCGLRVSEKISITDDGFNLSVNRLEVITPTVGPTGSARSSQDRKLPVLIIHGLMQDCESFLCCGKQHSLASVLAHEGFDVWLGNNRGNRYSYSHEDFHRESESFWDFSIDNLAHLDVPAMIRTVLDATGQEQVVVIGFSQGSAQTFLALSRSPELCRKVALFIAISPPLQLKGFSDSVLASVVAAHPWLLTSVFGQKDMLSCVLHCRNIMSLNMFSGVVLGAMKFLFGWECKNISEGRRGQLFQHVFSPSSVKCVLHWFQIMAHVVFLPWTVLLSFVSSSLFPPVPEPEQVQGRYSFEGVTCPVAILAGAADGLIDTKDLSKLVPHCVHCHVEPTYEHLDLIWADCAAEKIFPKIVHQIRCLV